MSILIIYITIITISIITGPNSILSVVNTISEKSINLYCSREFTVKDQTITEWRFNYGKMIDEVSIG